MIVDNGILSIARPLRHVQILPVLTSGVKIGSQQTSLQGRTRGDTVIHFSFSAGVNQQLRLALGPPAASPRLHTLEYADVCLGPAAASPHSQTSDELSAAAASSRSWTCSRSLALGPQALKSSPRRSYMLLLLSVHPLLCLTYPTHPRNHATRTQTRR